MIACDPATLIVSKPKKKRKNGDALIRVSIWQWVMLDLPWIELGKSGGSWAPKAKFLIPPLDTGLMGVEKC